jgi:hypothetical protein
MTIKDEPSERVKSRRKKAPKWVKDCISHWQTRVYEGDMGCDWDEADVRCWRCGYLRTQQKCHIIPKSLGGGDEPANLIALCAMCHDEMPNVQDAEEVWRWINKDHGELHDTYWTMRAIKESGLSNSDVAKVSIDELRRVMDEEVSTHFAQASGGARLTPSTLSWALRKACGKS